MKLEKVFVSVLFIVMITVGLTANSIIKNPDTPLNKKNGRQVPLTKTLTIEDDGENFFLKWPHLLKIAEDNCIFVLDDKQLLRLSPGGKFLKNVWQYGQGAGEATSISNYLLLGNKEILVHNHHPNKILRFDGQGKYVDEKRIMPNKFMTLFHEDKNNFYYYEEIIKQEKVRAKIIDVYHLVLAVSKKDNSYRKVISFPVKKFVVKASRSYGKLSTTSFLISPFKENLFFISHTSEYGIKLVDINTGMIVREFRRNYSRVLVTEENKEFVKKGRIGINGEVFKSPLPKYLNDIQSIHFVDGNLWVFTSTVNDKGVLVDIFNEKGVYIDAFFINFPNHKMNHLSGPTTMAVAANTICLIETNEDEDYVITKYSFPSQSKQ